MADPAGEVRGVGMDLVSVSRFARALERWGERLADRVFTPAELAYARAKARPEIHLAARFAAKEAVLKALGTGLSRGARLRDVEVLPAGAAPPEIALHGAVLVISRASEITRFHVSLTHTGDYAAACVVAWGKAERATT